MSVVYFLLLVGVLVLIHELGHFAAAKLLDFKVLRFSLGFGRPLVRATLGETEYQVGLMPLGGYVRILGEDGADVPSKDAGRSFHAKPLWQRLLVVFAGPAANLLLPVFIYFVLFAGHSHLPAAVIGDILEGGPAARAGLMAGDRVVAIDDSPVRYWEELERAVQGGAGEERKLAVERADKTFEKYIVPIRQRVRQRTGQAVTRGFIGVTHAPFLPLVGVIDPRSPAALAGLRTGDLVISVDGEPVHSFRQLRELLAARPRRSSVVYLRGQTPAAVPPLTVFRAHFADLVPDSRVAPDGARTVYTGLEPAEMFITRVDPDSPAADIGLRPGDLITALDDAPIYHWIVLDQRLQSRPKATFTLTWKRAGAGGEVTEMSSPITQRRITRRDEYGNSVEYLAFGAHSEVERGQGELVPLQGRFRYAAGKAVGRTAETIGMMTGGLVSLLRGHVPGETVGGPLMMFRVASVSGNKGWQSFLLMLALISVNLGLINLLPVPVLDGGHLVVFAAEGVRRRPLSPRTRARIQYVGLALVGVIMVLAVRNDVIRYLLP
ncbi:MAG: hypothetical protein Tsb0020_23950 [Haliangiales bacterium]